MKRWISLALLMALLIAAVPAHAAVKVYDAPNKAEIHLNWKPTSSGWVLPKVKIEKNRVIISGLSALGVLDSEMKNYHYSAFGGWSTNKKEKPLKGKVILNGALRTLQDAFSTDGFSLKTKSPLKKLHINYLWWEVPTSFAYEFEYKNGARVTLEENKNCLRYKGKNWNIQAYYDSNGKLDCAYITEKKVKYTYGRQSVLSDLYELLSVVPPGDVYWSKDLGEWWNIKTEKTAKAPKGINLKKLPFQIIGNPVPAKENGQEDTIPEFAQVPNENAVYARWPGGKQMPSLPTVQKTINEDGSLRLTVAGLANWGVPKEDLREWTSKDGKYDGEWIPSEDSGDGNILTLNVNAPNGIVSICLTKEKKYRLDYSPNENSYRFTVTNGGTEYFFTNNRWMTDKNAVTYSTPAYPYVKATYDDSGALLSYSVQIKSCDKQIDCTYSYDLERGAKSDKPLLDSIDVRQEGKPWISYSPGEDTWWKNTWDDGLQKCKEPKELKYFETLPLK